MERSSDLFWTAVVCLFLILAFFLYYPALDAPMYYDSVLKISMNESVFANNGVFGALSIFPQRPIPMITFYLNYLAGGMAPEYFRILNLILLVTTSLLVALLIDLMLDLCGQPRGSVIERKSVSFFLGLLFLVHPLQTFVTIYIWQRSALMACLFSYASLAVYLGVRSGRWRNSTLGYSLCLMFFICGLLAKENAFILPIVFLLAEVAFFKPGKKELLRRASAYSAILIILLGLVTFLQHPHGRSELGQGILTTVSSYYQEEGLTLKEVVLTQCRVLFHYLYIIILPLPSNIQLISPQVLSKGLLDPPVSLIASLSVLVLAGWAIRLLSRRPLLGFGILFYLIALLPEALLVPTYAFFGYRPILPMFGLWLIAADCLLAALQLLKTSSMRRFAIAGVGILLLLASVLAASVTHKKADSWRNPIEFWEETVSRFDLRQKNLERFSTSQALNNLGKAHILFGSPADAVPYLKRSIEIRSDSWDAYHDLGVVYRLSGDLGKAVSYWEIALRINPKSEMTKRALENTLKEIDSHTN